MRAATMDDVDRIAYAGYIERMLTDFRLAHGENAHVWNNELLNTSRRVPVTLDTSDRGAWRGPWHIARKWVSTEFRVWIDEYQIPRLTFTEWQAEAIATRQAEADREREYTESPDFCLDELQTLRELNARRDELIVTARERGATWATIGEAIGMSRAQLHNVATRHAAMLAETRVEIATVDVGHFEAVSVAELNAAEVPF
jgi:hypothetical protein